MMGKVNDGNRRKKLYWQSLSWQHYHVFDKEQNIFVIEQNPFTRFV
jgi:hypothetical protein